MLSSSIHPVYAGEDDDDDDLDDDEIDDDADDDTSSSYPAVTVAVAEPLTPAPSSSAAVTVAIAATDSKPIAVVDDSRKLFQRLWTDEDEIELLKGFLEYTGGGVHHHPDTAAFYDQIKGKLRLEFNKNQLVEKLRRLKKKYRTVMGKIESGKEYVFKSAHDQATFEISKKIWFEPATRIIEYQELNPNADNSNTVSFNHNHYNGVDLNLKGSARPKKRAKPVKSEELPQFSQPIPQVTTPVLNPMPGLIEEAVKSCLTPIFKELAQSATNSSRRFGGLGPLGWVGGSDTSNEMGEKWRKQQMLELEVYSKRLALVQDQIKSAVEELRSKGS